MGAGGPGGTEKMSGGSTCAGDRLQLLPERGALVELCHPHLAPSHKCGRSQLHAFQQQRRRLQGTRLLCGSRQWLQADRLGVSAVLVANSATPVQGQQEAYRSVRVACCTSPNSRSTSRNMCSLRIRRLARLRWNRIVRGTGRGTGGAKSASARASMLSSQDSSNTL